MILGWKMNFKYFCSVDIEGVEGIGLKTIKMLKAIPIASFSRTSNLKE